MADTLSCQWETLHSQQLRSIKKSIDSDHGIYRDLRNVDANYPFERSHNSGDRAEFRRRDYSRSSCNDGRRSAGSRHHSDVSASLPGTLIPAPRR